MSVFEYPFVSAYLFSLAGLVFHVRHSVDSVVEVGFLSVPETVHLKSSMKDFVVEYRECQQNQQKLGSLEVFLDQPWCSGAPPPD